MLSSITILNLSPRGPQIPVRSDLAESETLVESDGVGEVDVDVAAAIFNIKKPFNKLQYHFNNNGSPERKKT